MQSNAEAVFAYAHEEASAHALHKLCKQGWAKRKKRHRNTVFQASNSPVAHTTPAQAAI
jgi:transcription-repair coupling factor (superfamily II helicase)